jgi:glycosyltransferase involved in cell wall biosynthesis
MPLESDALPAGLPRPTVLQVCSIKGRGGTGYMAVRVARLLAEAGCRVFVAPCPGSKLEERARAEGLPVVEGLRLRRGFHPLDLCRDVRILRRTIRREAVDIVHTWHSIETWTGLLATLRTPARLARTRGLVTPPGPHLANRLLHARTGALFVTCGRIRTAWREAGFSMETVFDLVDGVDHERFRPGRDGSRIRAEAGVPPGAFCLASVGRLEPVKAQATILRALVSLPESVHLLLAGGGSLRGALEEEAVALGVRPRTHFLGIRSDVEDVLAAADAYVLASRGSEGSSRATLEAMAAGLPAVTTPVGSLPDIVRSGETGLLFPPGDADVLSAQIGRLLGDDDLRGRLGRAARDLIERERTETAMVRSLLDGYAQVLYSR